MITKLFMEKSIVSSAVFYMIPCIVVLCCCCTCFCHSSSVEDDSSPYNSFTVSRLSYPKTQLEPYAWRYIRVDLPPWFSSMSIAFESDVDQDVQSIEKLHMNMLPMICLRDGSPPLPDISDISFGSLMSHHSYNWTFGDIHGHQNLEQCFPMRENVSLMYTNEQISSGVWYFGFFNGIGPMRTQSKMITRGPSFSFTASIKVKGCMIPTLWGQYCNLTVEPLTCYPYNDKILRRKPADVQPENPSMKNTIYCANSLANFCLGVGEVKFFSLEVTRVVEQFVIMTKNVIFNEISTLTKTVNASEFKIICFARYGAIPLVTLHDYSSNIIDSRLVISSPKIGRWYITFLLIKLPAEIGQPKDKAIVKACYSMNWKVLSCPDGSAGINCTNNKYFLQTVLRKDLTSPFESYYMPESEKEYPIAVDFPLEPLLSNFSSLGGVSDAWTYFLLDVPRGAAGGSFHFHFTSKEKMNYEMYVRYGGLPSINNWDFFYANKTSDSRTVFGKLYNSSGETVDLYIFYVKEGTWSFGLRHPNFNKSASKSQTVLAISLERCPKKCFTHGTCRSVMDTSGLTIYSYCFCDRDHGGYDCSVEIVSHRGHIWQSIALIASNAAAVFPAFWTLRKKAFAEFVLFTSSGIFSGLYHACDVGTWCVLNFHALQFMDFWLSFMAVINTFVYLGVIEEASKRTIHTGISILTALMAVTGPTRYGNIILVIAIGVLGLLIGWVLEFTSRYRAFPFLVECHLDMHAMWEKIRNWVHNLVKIIIRRFHWVFVVSGFIMLAMAGVSWRLETSKSYWIWHSFWHVCIYTSSFLFLYSKIDLVVCTNPTLVETVYELAQQDSNSLSIG